MAKRQDVAAAVEQALEEVEQVQDQKVEQQARRSRAVTMALTGLTYEQIGDALGISASGAYQLVQRTLENTRNYAVDEMRNIENARLDRAQAAIWTQVINGDLKAVNTFLRISERRARMNGLDAPSKVQMDLTVRQEMEQALKSLEQVILDAEIVEDEVDVVTAEEQKALTHDYIIDPEDEDGQVR